MVRFQVSLPEDASYGDICREFVRRACFLHRISRGELAERLGIQKASIGTQVYRGQLGLEKAMALAELAQASEEECGSTHMAWLDSRTGAGSRRTLLTLIKYREEFAKVEAFLKAKGLIDEYVASQGALDPDVWGRPKD